MRKQIKQILVLIIALQTGVVMAQDRESDTLRTNVIDVVKPYTPSISDAFKVKETPSNNDTGAVAKKAVDYSIISVPVASTFTPAKGKAAVIDKAKKVKLYNNYATLGAGNYNTILGDVYLNYDLNRDESLGAFINHHSSGGGVDGVELKDGFIDSEVNLNYKKGTRDFVYNIDGGLGYQSFNWYGIPENMFASETVDLLNVKHQFYNGYIGGDIDFQDAVFDNAKILYRNFSDNNSSSEHRIKADTKATFAILDEAVSANIFVDFINGKFEQDFFGTTAIDYGNVFVGLSPSYDLSLNDFDISLGATGVYLNDTASGKSKFFVYPNIKASYNVLDNQVVAFAGVTGGLQQNSYYDFAQSNAFVSPTLFITPTDNAYKGFAGIKGKLNNAFAYNFGVNYGLENNKALFKHNSITSGNKSYMYGNSFGVVYDDVNTLEIAGEVQVDVNRDFTLGLKASYFNYDTKNELSAWNLPNITGSLFADYQITDKWFAGANLFFVGEREDQQYVEDALISSVPVDVKLGSYFDANANLGYHINDRLSMFARVNNIVGENYTKWQNYPVQGFQVLGGATYKFDF